jgi:TPP-dependent pyruvate/acetoin dehydrogenase alpha subunit
VADRAIAYGIPSVVVDGNDVMAVYEVVKKAVDRARNGKGPSLVEGLTYRWEGHYKGDPEVYRSRDEVSEWRLKHDPIEKFGKFLVDKKVLSHGQMRVINSGIEAEIEEAVKYALESPEPPLESLMENIYSE